MKGLPYLPKRNFVITFFSNSVKSRTHEKLALYLVWALVEKKGFSDKVQRYRTGNRHHWHEMDRLEKMYGNLIGLIVKFEDMLTPVIVLDAPTVYLEKADSVSQLRLPIQ